MSFFLNLPPSTFCVLSSHIFLVAFSIFLFQYVPPIQHEHHFHFGASSSSSSDPWVCSSLLSRFCHSESCCHLQLILGFCFPVLCIQPISPIRSSPSASSYFLVCLSSLFLSHPHLVPCILFSRFVFAHLILSHSLSLQTGSPIEPDGPETLFQPKRRQVDQVVDLTVRFFSSRLIVHSYVAVLSVSHLSPVSHLSFSLLFRHPRSPMKSSI